MAKNGSVAYIWHHDYTKESDNYIPTKNRNEIVHSLIEAYGLLDHMMVVTPKKATNQDLAAFHSMDYLNYIEEYDTATSSDNEEYGLEYDCPHQEQLIEYCHRVAGGTIDAAKMLNNGFCKIAIHWLGGWHHAKRSNASGYCYINDCVLGLIELRKKFRRVLYVDIDLHHGDGVEEAFCATDKVMTLSFHKFEPGFFPGTGSREDIGYGKGKHHTVNVPLLDGMRDANFCNVFDKISQLVYKKFKPDAILFQLGADNLNEDPMFSFNLTQKSHVHCVKEVLKWGLPTLLVGGGGYNPANTARCWASVTAAVVGVNISEDIPEHEHFLEYGPQFELAVPESLRKDLNSVEYVDEVVKNIAKNLC